MLTLRCALLEFWKISSRNTAVALAVVLLFCFVTIYSGLPIMHTATSNVFFKSGFGGQNIFHRAHM